MSFSGDLGIVRNDTHLCRMKVIRTVHLLRRCAVILLLMAAPLAAHADQTDPRLDDLFATLKSTADKNLASEVQQEIWDKWTSFDADPKIDAQMREGVRLMESGSLRQAEAVFGDLAGAAPDFAEAWNKRATVRFLMGDFNGSKSDIARTLALEPRHFGALSGLGMIHAHEGNFDNALLAYKAAARQNPHMFQVEKIIRQLQKKLKGEAL